MNRLLAVIVVFILFAPASSLADRRRSHGSANSNVENLVATSRGDRNTKAYLNNDGYRTRSREYQRVLRLPKPDLSGEGYSRYERPQPPAKQQVDELAESHAHLD